MYVYAPENDFWTEQAELSPTNRNSVKGFGSSVALNDAGTTAIVGAQQGGTADDQSAGPAYVFTRNDDTWTQQTELAPDDRDCGDDFGAAVAMSSDGPTAIVGAVGDEDPNSSGAGSGYVFALNGSSWSKQTKLAAEEGDDDDGFEASVAMTDDGLTAIVGSDTDDDSNGDGSGSASVFGRRAGSWAQWTKLAPDDGDSEDRFGSDIATSADGSVVLTGAWADEEPNGFNAGSAYVFGVE